MHLKNKICLILAALLLISGCRENTIQNESDVSLSPIVSGEYGYYLPYSVSDAKVIHNNYQGNSREPFDIGSQALNMAKKYFDPQQILVQEGAILSGEELERYDAYQMRGLGLLRYMTSYNPEGLNPERGSYIDNDNGIRMYNPIIVADIYEIDYVQQAEEGVEYAGFTFVIVLNGNVTYWQAQTNEDGSVATDENGDVLLSEQSYTTEMSDEQLFTYGSVEAGARLVNYLRNNHPEVGNLPIHILLYRANDAASELPGKMIGETYVTDRTSSYTRLNQQWVFVPSDAFRELNAIVANQFESMRTAIFEHFPSNVGIFGRAYFEDNYLKKMNIEVNIQATTYIEAQSLIQYLVSLCDLFQDADYDIKIDVLSDEQTIAILTRPANETNVEVVMNY